MINNKPVMIHGSRQSKVAVDSKVGVVRCVVDCLHVRVAVCGATVRSAGVCHVYTELTVLVGRQDLLGK